MPSVQTPGPLPLSARIHRLVARELEQATAKHGRQHSAHEGYAVLLEEVDELWAEVKANDPRQATLELIQVAAMAHRMLADVYAEQVAAIYDRLDNNGSI